jgi:uncharacterized membrane protein YedE/YeeE
MKNALAALVVGFVFAIGLGLSGMTQPQKVIGFLDIFSSWDPSLIFVMVGAIGVHFVTYKIIRKRESPMFDIQWHVPTKTELTPALIAGSLLFGVGWGLAGFCPGPALTSIASLSATPLIFVFSMITGMLIYKKTDKVLKFKK